MRKLLVSMAVGAVIAGGTLAGAAPANAGTCEWNAAWFFFGLCTAPPPPPGPPPPPQPMIDCNEPESPC